MPDYLCRKCGLIRVPEEETSLSAIVAPGLRFHTLCGYVVKEMTEREEAPEPAPSPVRAAIEAALHSTSWHHRKILSAALEPTVRELVAAAFRAGQERMRERAGHEAEALHRDAAENGDRCCQVMASSIAESIRALPLEERE